jgi:ribonuclease HI
VFTDSSYVVNSVEKGWALKWQKNNWMRTKTEKAVNYDLWEKLLNIVEKHEVKFNWVRGHNGHEENERCDTLATNEILKKI